MTKEQKIARKWNRLKPGFNRVWLTKEDVAALQELRVRGAVGRFEPHVELGAFTNVGINGTLALKRMKEAA